MIEVLTVKLSIFCSVNIHYCFSDEELEDGSSTTMDMSEESNSCAPDLNKAPQCLGSDDDEMDASEDLSQTLEQLSFDENNNRTYYYMSGMGQNECKLQ